MYASRWVFGVLCVLVIVVVLVLRVAFRRESHKLDRILVEVLGPDRSLAVARGSVRSSASQDRGDGAQRDPGVEAERPAVHVA
jgi:hypothetical protein